MTIVRKQRTRPPLRFSLGHYPPRRRGWTGGEKEPELPMPIIDSNELGRSFMWQCVTCQERRHDVQTNHTALKHINEYPDHVVVGTGTTLYEFKMSLIDSLQQGRQVRDVPIPDQYLASPE